MARRDRGDDGLGSRLRAGARKEHEEIICVGRYYLNRSTNFAEVSYLLRNDYQRRGIGSYLVKYLARIARETGIAGFDAEILADNPVAMRVLPKLGFPVETQVVEGTHRLRVRFERPPKPLT